MNIKDDNVVYIKELGHYDYTDEESDSGYFNCPNCGLQGYVYQAEQGEIEECRGCGINYIYR